MSAVFSAEMRNSLYDTISDSWWATQCIHSNDPSINIAAPHLPDIDTVYFANIDIGCICLYLASCFHYIRFQNIFPVRKHALVKILSKPSGNSHEI